MTLSSVVHSGIKSSTKQSDTSSGSKYNNSKVYLIHLPMSEFVLYSVAKPYCWIFLYHVCVRWKRHPTLFDRGHISLTAECIASSKSIVICVGEKFKLISLHLSIIALSVYKYVSYFLSGSRQKINGI